MDRTNAKESLHKVTDDLRRLKEPCILGKLLAYVHATSPSSHLAHDLVPIAAMDSTKVIRKAKVNLSSLYKHLIYTEFLLLNRYFIL